MHRLKRDSVSCSLARCAPVAPTLGFARTVSVLLCSDLVGGHGKLGPHVHFEFFNRAGIKVKNVPVPLRCYETVDNSDSWDLLGEATNGRAEPFHTGMRDSGAS